MQEIKDERQFTFFNFRNFPPQTINYGDPWNVMMIVLLLLQIQRK